MLITKTIPYISKAPKSKTPPVQAGPVLESALYNPTEVTIELTFDRAVSFAGLVGAQVTINDPVVHGTAYIATGTRTVLGSNSVLIVLDQDGESTGSAVLLNATASNGIVAVDGGQAWAGVSGFVMTIV